MTAADLRALARVLGAMLPHRTIGEVASDRLKIRLYSSEGSEAIEVWMSGVDIWPVAR